MIAAGSKVIASGTNFARPDQSISDDLIHGFFFRLTRAR